MGQVIFKKIKNFMKYLNKVVKLFLRGVYVSYEVVSIKKSVCQLCYNAFTASIYILIKIII